MGYTYKKIHAKNQLNDLPSPQKSLFSTAKPPNKVNRSTPIDLFFYMLFCCIECVSQHSNLPPHHTGQQAQKS